jgi:serine/threonine protein kinase
VECWNSTLHNALWISTFPRRFVIIFLNILTDYISSVLELTEAIKKAEFQFHEDSWSTISADAKDLINSCLNSDPKTRCLPSEALMHPWIANVNTFYHSESKHFTSKGEHLILGFV